MALFTTFITTPIVMAVYKPARRTDDSYKHHTILRPDSSDTDTGLRILACFHGSRNIPTIINLVESSRGTRRRGLTVYAVHLMELSERSSAISMVHKARRNGLPFWNKSTSGGDDHVVVAFQAYRQLSNVTVRSMTAISDLETMHEDIVSSANSKKAAFVILPFHKLQRVDGSMESIGHAYQNVNQRVLRHAPCSVGILVDRGLGGTAQVSASEVSYSVAVLFFGGADDREALAYGARMAEHPGIALTVLRINPRLESGSIGIGMNTDDSSKDEEHLEQFKKKAEKFEEKVVSGKAEIIAAIRTLGRCNLILVGLAPPIMSLTEHRNECPELGPVGSYLATSNATSASVLVIKQYDPSSTPVEDVVDPVELPDTPVASTSNASFAQ